MMCRRLVVWRKVLSKSYLKRAAKKKEEKKKRHPKPGQRRSERSVRYDLEEIIHDKVPAAVHCPFPKVSIQCISNAF